MSEKTKAMIQKYSRIIFLLLAWGLLIGIIIQVSLAGLAVFVDGSFWKKHIALINVIEFIPSLMFIFGLAGEIPKLFTSLSFVLFFFINFQYFTTFGWLGAIHSVFTLIIFITSLYIAWGAHMSVVNDKKKNNDNK